MTTQTTTLTKEQQGQAERFMSLLKGLALRPYSPNHLANLLDVFRVIKTRYPKFVEQAALQDSWERPLFQGVSSSHQDLMAPIDPKWNEYAQSRPLSESSGVSLGRGSHVDPEVVTSYLALLKSTPLCMRVFDSIIRESGLEEILERTRHDSPIVIPIQNGYEWSFAVAYPDCVHWFNSNPESQVPKISRVNLKSWTGPKHNKLEDSGLFMLIGIRLIAQGFPHLDQASAIKAVETIRTRVLIELFCGRINPSSAEVETAMRGDNPTTTAPIADVAHSDNHISPSNNRHRATKASSNSNITQTSPSGDRGITTQRKRVSQHRPLNELRPIIPQPTSPYIDILNIISDAVSTCRMTNLPRPAHVVVLWSLIKNGVKISDFHRRYVSLLFYRQTAHLDTTTIAQAVGCHNIDAIQSLKPEMELWHGLCESAKAHKFYEYVFLCGIPIGRTDMWTVETAVTRCLGLRGQLEQAQGLCEAIVSNTLADDLMIDLYPIRKPNEVSDESYRVYINPRRDPVAIPSYSGL